MTNAEFKSIVNLHITPNLWKTPENSMGWINEIVYSNATINTHSTQIALGIAIQLLIASLLRAQYSNVNVPVEVLGHGTEGMDPSTVRAEAITASEARRISDKSPISVTVYTRLPVAEIIGILAEKIDAKKRAGDMKPWTQEEFAAIKAEILGKYEDVTANPIVAVTADIVLCKNEEGMWYIIEVKQSGDCDSGKTPDVLVKCLLLPLICLGKRPSKAILGIIQNNKGRRKSGEWKGSFASYIDTSIYLLEEEFGKFFLPSDVSWPDFVDGVRTALGEEPI